MSAPLATAIARRGRWVLLGGLAVGLASPDAAALVRPFVGEMIVGVLFLALLRIGPAGLRVGRAALLRATAYALVLQLLLPVSAAVALLAAGWLDTALGLGAVLILAAAPLTGAAPIAAMAGGDPAPALRQSVIGTALLPLTVLPVFALAPAFGDGAAVLATAARLLAVIALAAGAAALLRGTGLVTDAAPTAARLDAAASLLLGLVVVGLMASVAETLRAAPRDLGVTLALVCALAFGLQAAAARLAPRRAAIPLAVVAGNRNVALFLGVLPAPVVEDLMLVIGCYQIPMYLTPLVLPLLLPRRASPSLH